MLCRDTVRVVLRPNQECWRAGRSESGLDHRWAAWVSIPAAWEAKDGVRRRSSYSSKRSATRRARLGRGHHRPPRGDVMEQDIRLGRIAGIPVGMNWSIGFIFVLIAWEMADLVLPAAAPHASSAVCWTVGLAATVLFFVSLLAHEVSHAIVATHHGVAVRRITLWLFGGVSELESNALSPSADFRIAVVGPLTSLALAAVFGLARLALGHGSGTGAVLSAAIGWLAWISLALGVFNLVPAATLDGGRVLRAALWARSGDRASAAAAATRAGQGFGYLLVAFGILEFLAVGIFGLW